MKASRASVRQAQHLASVEERLEQIEQTQEKMLEMLEKLLAAQRPGQVKAPAPKKEASNETKS